MSSQENISYTNYYDQNQKLRILNIPEFLEFAKHIIYEPHRLAFYAVILVTKGITKHRVGNHDLCVEPGEMLLISSRQLHYFYRETQAEGYVLSFSDDFFMTTLKREYIYEVDELLSKFQHTYKFRLCPQEFEKVHSTLQLIYSFSHSANTNNQLVILENLLTVFLHTINRSNANTKPIAEVKNKGNYRQLALLFRVLVKDNMRQEQSLPYYLEALDVSQSTLQIATKHTFNQSPKEIMVSEMISIAKFKLADPLFKIQTIAEYLGFNQATNFTKFFKKYTNLTPAEYRNSLI